MKFVRKTFRQITYIALLLVTIVAAFLIVILDKTAHYRKFREKTK